MTKRHPFDLPFTSFSMQEARKNTKVQEFLDGFSNLPESVKCKSCGIYKDPRLDFAPRALKCRDCKRLEAAEVRKKNGAQPGQGWMGKKDTDDARRSDS